ncbi:hypothetical protein [Actinophytocola sp.]|uniref:hypothetical protein n=1 Tax=Actinophytocola sp. TaxID=1872138 RepID=UPI00389ADA3D
MSVRRNARVLDQAGTLVDGCAGLDAQRCGHCLVCLGALDAVCLVAAVPGASGCLAVGGERDWCVAMLDNRHAALGRPASGPIFPSSTGTVREASNVRNRAWNPFKQRAGFEWVTFRTFRKTVAALLDEAGLTARQIADILGHARLR